jgi:hypothetical protein
VDGVAGVTDWVTTDARVQDCVVRKFYTYGMGRPEQGVDVQNATALAEEWQAGPLTIKELVRKLVLSSAFRVRSEQGDEP